MPVGLFPTPHPITPPPLNSRVNPLLSLSLLPLDPLNSSRQAWTNPFAFRRNTLTALVFVRYFARSGWCFKPPFDRSVYWSVGPLFIGTSLFRWIDELKWIQLFKREKDTWATCSIVWKLIAEYERRAFFFLFCLNKYILSKNADSDCILQLYKKLSLKVFHAEDVNRIVLTCFVFVFCFGHRFFFWEIPLFYV